MKHGKRGLVGYLSAYAISLTGTRLSMVALPWFVLVTTDSAAKTGLVAFCEMAPYTAAKLFGGPLIDKVGPRRVSVSADLLSTFVVGLVPLLYVLDLLRFPALLVLVAIAGMARGPGDTAKASMVPTIASSANVPLARVTGMSGTLQRLADTVGPAVAGVLIVWLGPLSALAIDAATFLAAGLIIRVAVSADARHAGADKDLPDEPYFRRLRAGFEFMRGERLLLAIGAMICLTNFIDAAVMSVVLPVWARVSGSGPAVIGAVTSAVGVTAVVGSLAATAFAHRLPRRTTFFLAFLIGGAPRIALLAFDLPVWLVIGVWALSGLALGLINPILSATIYERIPQSLLGRVSALMSTFAYAGTPIGGLAAGLLIAGVGLVPTVLVSATLYFVATTLPALRPEWRSMDTARQAAERPDRDPVTKTAEARAGAS